MIKWLPARFFDPSLAQSKVFYSVMVLTRFAV